MSHIREIPDAYWPLVAQVMLNGAIGGLLDAPIANVVIGGADETNAKYDEWLKEQKEE